MSADRVAGSLLWCHQALFEVASSAKNKAPPLAGLIHELASARGEESTKLESKLCNNRICFFFFFFFGCIIISDIDRMTLAPV